MPYICLWYHVEALLDVLFNVNVAPAAMLCIPKRLS